MERRKNDGCPVLKLVPCCPNTGGIQLTVTVWAAVGEQFLWKSTVNLQGNGSDMALCSQGQSLRISTDSWFQPQWEESARSVAYGFAAVGCYTSWLHVEKPDTRIDSVEGFGCLEGGRLHQKCGLLWSSLVVTGQFYQMCYSYKSQGGLTCWKCGLSYSG